MATSSEVIRIARAEVGYAESPANSNKTKYGRWYGMDGEPWCDMFVSWVFAQAGAAALVGGRFAYTPDHANWFKKSGQWVDREERPQPGDLVFFSNGRRVCHVGIVTARNGSQSVSTIEGNTSAGSDANGGQVQERVRTYGKTTSNWFIAGFGRPRYAAEAKPSGWQKGAATGKWRYADGKGGFLTGWKKLKWSKGTDWFYFDSNGWMLTGWQRLKWSKGTDWFYLAESGAMQASKLISGKGGKVYALASTGAMYTKAVPVDSSGALNP